MIRFGGGMDINHFKWEMLGDVPNGRGNLGPEMPVLVYRMFQYTMRDTLSKEFGPEKVVQVLRDSGELAGREFSRHMLNLDLPFEEFTAELQNILKTLKIGILRIEKFEPETGQAIMTVGEDLDCSGLPIVGDTVCNYDEGFLKGILGEYTKKNYSVTEIDCWATGARVCRFEAHVEENDG